MYVFQEFPKYIPLENGYRIVDNKEEEQELLKSIAKEEVKDESTSKDDSKGVDPKEPDAGRSSGSGRKRK